MPARKSLKRVIYRSLEEAKATIMIAKVTSVKDAIATFLAKVDIQRMNHNGFQEPPAVRRRLLNKHEVMLEYFEKEFGSFSKEYNYDRALPEDSPDLRERIWVCWWQGLENAPDLVKACIASIQRNAGRRKVTVITEDNYKDYVHIPEWVEAKYTAGIISRTHYSDLLRASLLSEHGGVWLDATFYYKTRDNSDYFGSPVWTIKRPDYLHGSIASGYFATYSLGCNYENRWIFATIRDFLLDYWKNNDVLIDYLMFDYLIVLAQRKDSRIAEAFESVSPNNPCCDELVKVLGEPFDETVWENMKKDTSLFKLTWKKNFPQQKNGQDTFYAKLLDGTL